MAISSRTPEGDPLRCVICGRAAAVEFSEPGADTCCPSCGSLAWRVRSRLAEALDLDTTLLTLEARLAEVAGDSLDMVELAMELEEEFEIDIPDEAAEGFKTLATRSAIFARRSGGRLN